MSKSFVVMMFSLLSMSAVSATPLKHLIHAGKPSHVSTTHHYRLQSVPEMQDYTDFTGEWSGSCRVNGSEQVTEKVEAFVINIKNNRDSIQLCFDDLCDDNDIGKDIQQYETQGEGFVTERFIFNWSWSSATRLTCNFSGIENHVFPDGSHVVSHESGRSMFMLKDDKLILQHEISEFDDTEEAAHHKMICELARR